MFIDIHNHMLFGVDDGATNIEESLSMLLDAKQQGAEAIVFTPHYRRGMFPYEVELVNKNFKGLEEKAAEIKIDLYLGCEYYVNEDLITNLQFGRCHTLAGSDYVLTEYSYYTEYAYLAEQTYRLISHGYFPVIAHVERYQCLQKKPILCAELSDMGAMIQINADSVLGLDGKEAERFCKKLLKKEWADIIASDAHGKNERVCHMKVCRELVEKKYGSSYAEKLFYKNPNKILKNE